MHLHMYTHTHTKIYPILIQLIVKIYNLIAGVIGEGLQHYNTSPIRIVKNEKTGTSEWKTTVKVEKKKMWKC